VVICDKSLWLETFFTNQINPFAFPNFGLIPNHIGICWPGWAGREEILYDGGGHWLKIIWKCRVTGHLAFQKSKDFLSPMARHLRFYPEVTPLLKQIF